MKRILFLVGVLVLIFGGAQATVAAVIFVDAAPNVYGSPDYDPWKAATMAAVANGSFVNMSNGTNPANVGTTDFEIQDAVVYSFGDLGKRLTWIYWLPGETVAGLTGTGRVQIGLGNWWDGVYDDFYLSYYGSSWLEPTKWEDYDDGLGNSGVIGFAGMAWWGAYGVNTQAALDADIASWGQVAETWEFTMSYDDGSGATLTSLTSNRAPIPEPATMLLLGVGLAGLAGGVWRKTK